MFGVSFSELLLVGMVALVIVGPKRLPKLLGTLGRWSAKLRRITTEVRYQSGIDDLLRKEGFSGGLNELRQMRNSARTGLSSLINPPQPPRATPNAAGAGKDKGSAVAPAANAALLEDPFADVPYDRSREYPNEGCDAQGSLPDDLWSEPVTSATAPGHAGASPKN